jgi:tetratricopeptide (TPR) repeat protein
LSRPVAHDGDRLSRFEREAKAVARLSHPNILAIFDFRREGEITYAVTELLEGDSLRSRMRKKRLTERQAIEQALKICSGLAAAELRKVLEIDPDYLLALPLLAGALVRQSESGQALSILRRVMSIADRSPFHLGWLGWALGVSGERDEARTIQRELVKRSGTEYISPLFIAWALSGLGEMEEAFGWLQKAFEEKNMYLLFWKLPVFDSMSSNPAFHELRRRFDSPG